jgi:hypothetical protein
MNNRRKFWLLAFALLDMAVFGSMYYALSWPDADLCEGNMYALQLAQLFFALSLPIGALALCYQKRWALWLNYFQLPLRIGTQAWTLGVLLHFSPLLDSFGDWLVPGLNQPLSIALVAVLAAELARLIATISFDVKWKRAASK